MPGELGERLKSHARSFDSLLSLIPAKLYYGDDVSDQWKRKKQTSEQKRAAKKAKLDPDNWKSAKDVMDERAIAALKRKREEDGESSDLDVDTELPKVIQDQKKQKPKRRKTEPSVEAVPESKPADSRPKTDAENDEERKRRKAEQKAAKRERKQAKQAKVREKKDKLKNRKKEAKGGPKKMERHFVRNNDTSEDDDGDDGEHELAETIQIDGETAKNLSVLDANNHSTASPSPAPEPVFSPHIDSGSSSISSSSLQLPTTSTTTDDPQEPTPTFQPSAIIEETRSAARERLALRINELQAQRKAAGPEAKPARNRQELLEERRRKEAEKKRAKKEQRQKEREAELLKQEEEIAKRFSPGGSGSLLASPRSPMVEDSNFSFGRVAFGDGTQADATLSSLIPSKRQKGPADAGTTLLAAQNKAARLSGYDPNKRKEIQEKDMWLNAKKRAHGERVRDDTSLLKKALKRQEGSKKKSEKEWGERIEGVATAQHMKQKKREGNLQKRKDEKGGKGKGKKVKRPGFEGSFRGRTGGKRGK